MSIVSPRWPLMLALGLLAFSGCGGGGGGGDKTPAPAPLVEKPTPKQPMSAVLGPFTRAIHRQSCRDYTPLVLSASRGSHPGAPATAAECRGTTGTPAELHGQRIDLVGQYGTGGLMEGPAPGNARRYLMWAVDLDGRFRYSGVTGRGPAQAGTPFSGRQDAARVADRFVRSVRNRDCTTMERFFSRNASRLVRNAGSPRAACLAVLAGRFVAPAVRDTPSPHIETLGGTRNLAFVGIATKRVYFTMLLGDFAKSGYRIFDIVPSTPVKLP